MQTILGTTNADYSGNNECRLFWEQRMQTILEQRMQTILGTTNADYSENNECRLFWEQRMQTIL